MTTDTTSARRAVAELGAAVTAEMDPAYTLVYVEQGQTLSDDVIAALVRGDNEWETEGGERLTEWASDAADHAAAEKVRDLATKIVRRWEGEDDADYEDLLDEWEISAARDSAIEAVRDRDRSQWYTELATRSGAVLLRVGIPALDEDAGLSFKPMTPAALLDLLGFEHTDHNLTQAAEVVDNASPEYSVVMGYALLGVELTDIIELPGEADRQVRLNNPHVWLGSPFAGSGWCSEEAFTGTLTVRRGDLRTDDDAFGYSWSQVVGGARAKDFAGGSLTVPEPDPGSQVAAASARSSPPTPLMASCHPASAPGAG